MKQVIPLNALVKVIIDRDYGLLVGHKGTVSSYENNKYWVQFDNHPIPLPFNVDEVKRVRRTK